MEETRKFNIELYSGVRINNNHKLIELKYIPDIWEYFGWDIHKNKKEEDAAREITRHLICFGFLDLTKMNRNGQLLTLELLPPKED
jgi:hypothetical protein